MLTAVLLVGVRLSSFETETETLVIIYIATKHCFTELYMLLIYYYILLGIRLA